MKVLLLQEMSGVHTELKSGLRNLGCDADIATLGDFFKKYSTDVNLGTAGVSYFSALNRIITQISKIPTILSYDIIQSISPAPYTSFLDNIIDNRLTKSKKKVFIAAGSDPVYLQFVRDLDYFPPHIHFDRWSDEERDIQYQTFVNKLSNSYNRIIPVCWEYKYAMQKAGLKPEKVVPFPVNLQSNVPTKKTGTRLMVFHPLNRKDLRYDFKGTLLIQEAFVILGEKFPEVDFICMGNLTHQEYSAFTDGADIIVDQCYSYSYGMSAAYGLAKGKVVLSGLEEIVKEEEHYAQCPVINIRPDVDMIVAEIEKLLLDRKKLKYISEKSRSFAEKFHDSNLVAEKYLEIYQSL